MSHVHRTVILTCTLLVLSGVVSAGIPDQNTSSITLERGMCFGTCPVYSVTLFSNGSVRYDGQMYVKDIGIRNGSIKVTSYQRLMDLAEDVGFFEMNDEYTAYYITDMPSATITIINGTKKRVEHYFGDESAPKVLTEFEEAIDQAANVTQWTSPFEPDYSEDRLI